VTAGASFSALASGGSSLIDLPRGSAVPDKLQTRCERGATQVDGASPTGSTGRGGTQSSVRGTVTKVLL
jgi:hypothetical protein